ncbi:MAG: hypothetical protein WCP87_01630 [Atribacterota bacterium]
MEFGFPGSGEAHGSGVTGDDALDYEICGCAEPAIMGKTRGRYMAIPISIN